MSIPGNLPPKEPPPFPPTKPSQPSAGGDSKPVKSTLDPSGVWTKWLCASGVPPGEAKAYVEMFLQGVQKMLSLQIAREQKRMIEALKKMKRVAEGQDE